jgi:curved DNA-binding protein CbpA
MKLDSKYFDMIRIRPQKGAGARTASRAFCQWKGCGQPADHRAPMGRGHEGQYYLFCEEHIRQYNSSYNYFAGMGDAEVEAFQKDALTGHRPTWKVGANAWAHGTQNGRADAGIGEAQNPAGSRAQRFAKWRSGGGEEARQPSGRRLKPLEAKAIDTLGLDGTASREDIKARFKELVKRHHPDSNGGDRAAEEKLREIIQAYNYLKQAGLV